MDGMESVGRAPSSEAPEAPGEVVEDEARISRREALAKAAVAATTAGAVWAAPSISGLSTVPDYAAAGTLGDGCHTMSIRVGWVDAPPSGTGDCWGFRQPNCSGGNVSTPLSASAGTYGNSDTGPRMRLTSSIPQVPSPSGPVPAGNVSVNVNGWADGNGRIDLDIAWSVDPPFNRCNVTSVTGSIRGPGSMFGTGSPPFAQNNASAFLATSHNSTTGSGAANFAFTGTSPTGNQQGQDVTVTLTCDGPGNITC